ncbi:MAG: hypothetical protein F6K63_03900 [Moorea sp. SIO1G6]|uniref:hypothetical protein n=1 Tax=Moorena sp. SIO1G6 TaxID=2607840 RepID=UPI0013C269B0|nr:hypothetical protein [Moorena sp. SIO1G6]NET63589.1 hypothetical protein [Moorena sp. SIO1G6]
MRCSKRAATRTHFVRWPLALWKRLTLAFGPRYANGHAGRDWPWPLGHATRMATRGAIDLWSRYANAFCRVGIAGFQPQILPELT